MNNSTIKNIIICGNGLAGANNYSFSTGQGTAKGTPNLTLIDTLCAHEKDIFYGNMSHQHQHTHFYYVWA